MKNREYWIDNIKGFTIIAMVLAHACGSLYNSGIWDSAFTRNTNTFLDVWIMPVFFFTSGYLFNLAYIKDNKIETKRLRTQIYNLIWIYCIFSLLQIAIKMVFSKDVNSQINYSDLYLLPFKSIQQYWYIYTLLILYILGMLIYSKITNKTALWCCLAIISILAVTFNIDQYFTQFTAIKAVYNSVFFFTGMVFERIVLHIKKKCWVSLIIGLVLSVVIAIFGGNKWGGNILNMPAALLTTLGLGSLFYMYVNRAVKILSITGTASLEIYLLHMYFTSGLRRPIRLLARINNIVTLVVLVVAGVVGPLVISFVLKKTGIWQYIFKPFSRKPKDIKHM